MTVVPDMVLPGLEVAADVVYVFLGTATAAALVIWLRA